MHLTCQPYNNNTFYFDCQAVGKILGQSFNVNILFAKGTYRIYLVFESETHSEGIDYTDSDYIAFS